MTKEEKLFAERLNRVETAIHGGIPDRVPCEYSGVWVPAIRDRIPANRAMIPMRFQ